MRNARAKQLRRAAERDTVGQSPAVTRQYYKRLKKIYYKLKSGQ